MAPPQQRTPRRTALSSVGGDGSRIALHPADVRGRYTLARRLVALLLVAAVVLMPWIRIDGRPAVRLDFAGLRFHFFGATFVAEDLWLGFFIITGLGFALFFLTALFGRLWCGWACPQTVLLEHVYRRIERWLEGDAPERRRLDAAPWTGAKLLRRGGKHALFLVVSLVLAHAALAWVVSLPEVLSMVTHAPTANWGVFVFIVVATTLLYLNFGWFREQLCIIVCPYGRLQSALIDDDSVVIGYDERRGEPRGRRTAEAPAKGDCIDCFRCVQVCPTGIDIRQGLQMECIGCAACIDACDDVMARLDRPKGLVRYDSLRGLAGAKTRFLRPRTLLYAGLLLLGAIVAGTAFARRQPAVFHAVRMQGAPYFLDGDTVRNQFLVRVVNKSDEPLAFSLRAEGLVAAGRALEALGWDAPLEVPARGEVVRPLVLVVPRAEYAGGFPFTLTLEARERGVTLVHASEFAGPGAGGRRAPDAP